jgi:hypothetical protein
MYQKIYKHVKNKINQEKKMKNFKKISVIFFMILFFPAFLSAVISPDIKINNSDNDISLTSSDTLEVSIGLDTGEYSGTYADWKIQITTDDGLSFSYVYPTGWQTGDLYGYSGNVVDFENVVLLNLDNLTGIEGDFKFTFEILLNSGESFSDTVNLTISDNDISSQCDNSNITNKKYIMAFNAYDSEISGNDPQYHKIYFAGSDDGINWELIDAFPNGHSGSVPEIVFFNNFLYLFHTSGTDKHNFDIINSCFNIIDQGEYSVVDNTGNIYLTVDPSLIVENDELVLFYLPGVMGMDPASCGNQSSCEKEIDSAETNADAFPVFTKVDGYRSKETVGSEIMSYSDPEILKLDNGTYILYVSIGQSVAVYTSDSLNDIFKNAGNTGTLNLISNNAGGVPSAIQADNGEIWLYVHKTINGNSVIRRCISKDGITAVNESECNTVIDSSISDIFTNTTQFLSPSVIKWPDSTKWSTSK